MIKIIRCPRATHNPGSVLAVVSSTADVIFRRDRARFWNVLGGGPFSQPRPHP